MTEIRVPTLGESVTEATVATWFKMPGDKVAVDEMLCELETDKVTVEVPCTINGVVSEIVAQEGDTVELREKSKQIPLVLEAIALAERDVPEYLTVDHSKMSANFVRIPSVSDVPYPVIMEPNLVVEFYAKN